MKITKLGHCCFLVEENGLRILTDPGAWSEAQNELKNIHIILITHEHADHFHIASISQILKNNPEAKIFTNSAVGKLLTEASIEHKNLEHSQSITIEKVLIEGFGEKHADIYPGIPVAQNTGYFIGGRFWYPGDAFFDPEKAVEILALPVCGPWMHISDSIKYGLKIQPKVAIPVHDGMLKFGGPFHIIPQKFLALANIEFVAPKENELLNF